MLPKNYSVIFAFYILYISRLYLQLRRHFELLCQPFIITCLVILPDLIPACLLLSQLPRLACTSACLLEHFSVPLPRPSCGLLFTCLPPRASRWVSDPVTIVTLSVNNRPEQHLLASTPIPHPSGTVILSHHREATPPPPWPRLVPARLPLPEVSPGFQHPQLVQPERSVRRQQIKGHFPDLGVRVCALSCFSGSRSPVETLTHADTAPPGTGSCARGPFFSSEVTLP